MRKVNINGNCNPGVTSPIEITDLKSSGYKLGEILKPNELSNPSWHDTQILQFIVDLLLRTA